MRLIDADELIQSIRDNGLLGSAYSYQEREDDLVRKIERRAAQFTAQAKTNHDDVLSAIDLLDSYRNQDEISYNAYSELADAIYGLETAQPTAQERPVVMCNDCWRHNGCPMERMMINDAKIGNPFCAAGSKEDGAAE